MSWLTVCMRYSLCVPLKVLVIDFHFPEKTQKKNMNLDISRTTLGIAAGIAGTIFLSYCIYFDNKRRNDPEYKKKVREREYTCL